MIRKRPTLKADRTEAGLRPRRRPMNTPAGAVLPLFDSCSNTHARLPEPRRSVCMGPLPALVWSAYRAFSSIEDFEKGITDLRQAIADSVD